MTYTYAILEVSTEVYKEIWDKLLAAGYASALQRDGDRTVIDMAGIALAKVLLPGKPPKFIVALNPRLAEIAAKRMGLKAAEWCGVPTEDVLRGTREPDVVLVGQWTQRKDAPEIQTLLHVIQARITKFDLV